eukprot:scaffold7465_cov64-Phaeocystis_antarctica.AAC.1
MSTDSRARAREGRLYCAMQCRVLSRYGNHGASHPQPPRIGEQVSSYVPRRRASESLSYFRNATWPPTTPGQPPTSAPCRMIATGGGKNHFRPQIREMCAF